MAASTLPTPGKIIDGKEIGPCVDLCKHKDCAGTRRMANSFCAICEDPIGYETRFYDYNRAGDLAHASCVEKEAEA